jgi:hypothetical protein
MGVHREMERTIKEQVQLSAVRMQYTGCSTQDAVHRMTQDASLKDEASSD